MKRIISFCLCVVLTAALLPVGAAEVYETTIMEENFEGSTPLANFEYSAQVETTGAPAGVSAEAWGDHGTALSAVLNSGKQMAVKENIMSSHQDASSVNISFDLMLTDYANLYIGSWLYHSAGGPDLPRVFSFTSGGKIELWQRSATNSANYAQYQNYELNRWYAVSLFFDFASNSYSLYLDGNEITVGTLIYPEKDYTRLYKFRIDFGSTSNGNYVYLDNFRIARPSLLSLTGQSLPDNAAGVMVNNSVTLSFNNSLADVNASEIFLTAADGTVSYPSAYCGDTAITVSFADNPLLFNTDYVLTVGQNAVTDSYGQHLKADVSLRFKTMKSSLLATLPRFTDAGGMTVGCITPGQAITVQSTVYNYTDDSSAKAVLLVAAYDADGRCTLYYQPAETKIAVGGYQLLSVTVPAERPDIKTLKAITVDDLSNPLPLVNGYSVLSETDSQTVNGAAVVGTPTLSETSTTNDSVSGTTQCEAESLVIFSMYDADNALLAIEPKLTGKDSAAGYVYQLSDDEQAATDAVIYRLSVTGWQSETAAEQTVYYVNDDIRKEICKQLNQAQDSEAAGTVVEHYQKSFDLPENRFSSTGYTVLFEQKPYQDYTEAVAMLDKAYMLLEKINSLQWSQLSDFFGENSDIVLYGCKEEYKSYAALSTTKQNAVNQALLNEGSVTDFETLRTDFKSALKACQSTGNSSSGGSSSGSSGGGRGSASISLPSVKQTVTEEAAQQPTTAIPVDLNQAEWAREAILALVEEGIISGYGDHTFKPNDSVLREEFLKMLILALKLDGAAGESSFADAVTGAWYMPYLSIGQLNTLVLGDDNGCFGVGQSITREDAAVMLWRALQKQGYKSKATETTFSDEGAISDYAKEAVYNLAALGILSGMPDGSFAPQATLSRAQTATMLYQLRAITEG